MMIRLFQRAASRQAHARQAGKITCLRRGHPDGMQRFTINAGGCAWKR
ncbi:hypothetical protein MJ575_26925 [Klebsiella pneumoniae]|nr:hypothetical protein MJ575_26925 [Klebsiella pneumoniae]